MNVMTKKDVFKILNRYDLISEHIKLYRIGKVESKSYLLMDNDYMSKKNHYRIMQFKNEESLKAAIQKTHVKKQKIL